MDKIKVRELALYIENDYQLYQQMYVPIAKNYARKIVSKKFDRKMAIKGILNLVRIGLTKYNKEISPLPRFSQEEKIAVAKSLYGGIMELARDFAKGMLKKKKKKKR